MKIIFKISLFVCIAISLKADGSTFVYGQGTLFMTTSLVPYSKQIPLFIRKTCTRKHYAIVPYFWYDFLMQWRWQPTINKQHKTMYARTILYKYNPRKTIGIMMHRIILGVTNPQICVDHINHNGLDNTEGNIRVCTSAENQANRIKVKGVSKYMGVYKIQTKYKSSIYIYWIAIINSKSFKKKKKFTFTPEGEIEAAKQYDIWAKQTYGEFANPNFK